MWVMEVHLILQCDVLIMTKLAVLLLFLLLFLLFLFFFPFHSDDALYALLPKVKAQVSCHVNESSLIETVYLIKCLGNPFVNLLCFLKVIDCFFPIASLPPRSPKRG